MKLHNLTDWSFEFDYSVRRFGCCHYSKKKITLSRELTLLNDGARVKNTILHEIAHALLPKGIHHGNEWKQKAISIGCDGQRLYPNNVLKPKYKYIATCKNCGDISHYNRKRKLSCGKCSPRFNKKYLLKFKLL